MEEVIKFGDIEIQNKNFTSRKTISGKNVDITKIVVSSKVPFGKKGFT